VNPTAPTGRSTLRPGSDRRRDPSEMTPAAQLAEIGSILATGIRRLRLRQKSVDEVANHEPSCDAMVPPQEIP